MHDDAGLAGQQAAALGGDAIEGQQQGLENVQPLCPPADPKAGLVQVLHPRGRDVLAHDVSEAPQPLSARRAHPGDGRWNQLHAEQIGQEFRKPILRQKVIVQQIDHKGTDPRAILNWRGDALGNAADVTVWQFGQRQLWARCPANGTCGAPRPRSSE
jgi:hypothetical protein